MRSVKTLVKKMADVAKYVCREADVANIHFNFELLLSVFFYCEQKISDLFDIKDTGKQILHPVMDMY